MTQENEDTHIVECEKAEIEDCICLEIIERNHWDEIDSKIKEMSFL